MIVTRQRRKPFPWKRLILPLIAIALVALVFWWPPSRNVIANGPLAPLWRSGSSAFATIAKPFSFAAQNEVLTQRNGQIVALQKQIADLQSQSKADAKKLADANAQIAQLQTQSAAANAPKPAASASPGAAVAAAGSSPSALGASASTASDAVRRTAQYWANMEPENAAKLVQKLPVPYVAQVMAQMSPDAVGAILDALPATFAAQLTQEHPELKR